ncbi:MAG: PTS mannose transporter subunit IIC, partial [Lactobacillus sp.]|nr:PTS mannose transporter subunit IIC [Lactobacillus sp.]
YMNLPSVAVAAVGIIIVVIQWIRDKQIMDIENKQKEMVAMPHNENQTKSTEIAAEQEEEDFFS